MKPRLRHIVLLILVAFVLAARFYVHIGEWYSVTLYPLISSALSWLASWIPFSLEEIVVVGVSLLLIFIIIAGIRRREGFKKTFFLVFEILIWIYVWFYIGWGCNYYRESIYSRTGVERQAYDESVFNAFLSEYADSLNASFNDLNDGNMHVSPELLEKDAKETYASLSEVYGLSRPCQWQRPKRLLFNDLYSSVGVMGFVGPFFSETQINNDLLPAQIPFVYAHEYSHLLGVSSEDEANYWGYTTCIASDIPAIRYSGYFSLLPYVLANASRVLPEEEYRALLSEIRPEILQQYSAQRDYWNSKYSRILGKIQSAVYDAFLKGNKVSSGTASYLEVIDLIISFREC